MNEPNSESPVSSLCKPLSQWSDEELESLYKRLCPDAREVDLTTVPNKPKKEKKAPSRDEYI